MKRTVPSAPLVSRTVCPTSSTACPVSSGACITPAACAVAPGDSEVRGGRVGRRAAAEAGCGAGLGAGVGAVTLLRMLRRASSFDASEPRTCGLLAVAIAETRWFCI